MGVVFYSIILQQPLYGLIPDRALQLKDRDHLTVIPEAG
jgi:hypothetical protein